MSKKVSESDSDLKTSHKIIAALISFSGSIAAIHSFTSKFEQVRIKQAQHEIKLFYIEKQLVEHEKFKKWCEDLYMRPQGTWKKKD